VVIHRIRRDLRRPFVLFSFSRYDGCFRTFGEAEKIGRQHAARRPEKLFLLYRSNPRPTSKAFQAKYKRLTKDGSQGGSKPDHQKCGRTYDGQERYIRQRVGESHNPCGQVYFRDFVVETGFETKEIG